MIETYLSRAVLVAIRVGGLMSFAPFFSNAGVSMQVKAGLTLLLTFLLLPIYTSANAAPSGGTGSWFLMAFGEVMLGLMMGMTTQFVFDGMELAGQVVGFQFGFSLVNVIDPNSQVEVTVLATFHSLIALLIFMQLGVQRLLLHAVAASFAMIPPGSVGSLHLAIPALLRMSVAIWLIGAEIAFPVLLATMLTDLTIGFLTKASPQLPALFFGISTKVLLGLAVLYGVASFWPQLLERYFTHAMVNLEQLLALLRSGG